MKIALVISNVSCGKAKRVLVSMADRFIKSQHDVTVVTKNSDFYELLFSYSRLALNV